MDPRKEFTQDKVKPAVASTTNSTSTVPTSPSPPAGLHPGKRAIYHEKANKRVKLEVNYTSQYHAPRHHVHPSRLNLVEPRSNASRPAQTSSSPPETFGDIQLRDEVPLLQRTGSNTVPLGNVLKRKVMHSSGTDSAARRDSDVSRSSRALCANGLEGTGTNETLRETVRRQWRHSSLTYEQLLENRRTEHLGSKVDRYVPSSESRISYGAAASPRSGSSFPYAKLPEKVRAKILALLLVNEESIIIDFTWLRSFVNGHCRVPIVEKTIKDGGNSTYTIPMEWNQLVKDVNTMQKDCVPFKPALEDRGNKTRKRKAPCRGLTTGVLAVSRDVHAQAASVFYGNNTFSFPWPSSAWMQLESFLATIGPINVSKLRHITIHCPLWYRGIKEDFLEGAILDLTSPASRLGVVKPPSRDRLLSAIAGSIEALSKAGKLDNFAVELEHGLITERWAGNYSNPRRLIAMSEANEHITRKNQGVQILKSLSESLPHPPVLNVYHPTPGVGKHDLSEFRSRLASVIREALKYGWKVDQRLGRR